MIEESGEDTQFCPNCKKNIVKANYFLHTTHCQRYIEICQECLEPVPTRDLEEHLKKLHVVVECERCGKDVQKWKYDDHKENKCFKRPIACIFCELNVPWDEIKGHESYCGSRTEACRNCKKYIQIRDKTNHAKICIIQQFAANVTSMKTKIPCAYCEEEFPCHVINSHEENCNFRSEKCERCKKIILIKEKAQHLGECLASTFVYKANVPKTMAGCRYCDNEFQWNELMVHESECQTNREKCYGCEKYICRSDRETHLKKCLDKMISRGNVSCKFCKKMVNTCDYAEHEKTCSKFSNFVKYSKSCNFSDDVNKMECQDNLEDPDVAQLESKLAEFLSLKDEPKNDPRKILLENELWNIDEKFEKRSTINFDAYDLEKNASPENEDASADTKEKTSLGARKKMQKRNKVVLISCPFCFKDFPSEKIHDHIENCSDTETCSVCLKEFKGCDMASHIKVCCVRQFAPPIMNDRQKNESLAENPRTKRMNQNEAAMSVGRKTRDESQTVLPCEFCNQVFPDYLVIQHQSGCRPDLLHFPSNDEGDPLNSNRSMLPEDAKRKSFRPCASGIYNESKRGRKNAGHYFSGRENMTGEFLLPSQYPGYPECYSIYQGLPADNVYRFGHPQQNINVYTVPPTKRNSYANVTKVSPVNLDGNAEKGVSTKNLKDVIPTLIKNDVIVDSSDEESVFLPCQDELTKTSESSVGDVLNSTQKSSEDGNGANCSNMSPVAKTEPYLVTRKDKKKKQQRPKKKKSRR